MATITPAALCGGVVCVCFLVSAAAGQIIATAGHKVTLTCQAPNNISFIAVNWSRSDLGEKYVLLVRDGHLDPVNQHPSFKKRAELQDRQMKDGDVSVSLKNVTINDTGTYECRVFMGKTRSWKLLSIIYLRVAPPPGPTGGTTEDGGKEDGGKEDGGKEDGRKEEGSVGLIVGLSVPAVVLVAAGVGFWIYRKHQEQQSQDLNSPPAQAQTQMSLSSFQPNSELPAAVPLLSVVPEHRDRNDLRTDGIQQHPTNTPDFTLTLEEEPLHHPQQTAGLHQEAVTSPGYEHPGCDGLMEPKGHL